ncbi:uncharacterized protein AMSG_10382 [Thecamonas trahens ATCC 50062]|uniref:Uncharacterized protein n=1 Tax=Thecamonas trahens ATCC 50062 TaxID=461836 RepID=A0A0L0DQI6_THETB|nr:hypothetical protein AMSG_10382 [Thecamonas trahens ATCC 50062]KNC54535.1 hypothetical protein AMSG_10382 [Thecamonas trahens ATCC 50062]|eukprot:XP_013753552.1 hypothetical protein AMSG_10382 [Thecamonas trahens ATCC 50062]
MATVVQTAPDSGHVMQTGLTSGRRDDGDDISSNIGGDDSAAATSGATADMDAVAAATTVAALASNRRSAAASKPESEPAAASNSSKSELEQHGLRSYTCVRCKRRRPETAFPVQKRNLKKPRHIFADKYLSRLVCTCLECVFFTARYARPLPGATTDVFTTGPQPLIVPLELQAETEVAAPEPEAEPVAETETEAETEAEAELPTADAAATGNDSGDGASASVGSEVPIRRSGRRRRSSTLKSAVAEASPWRRQRSSRPRSAARSHTTVVRYVEHKHSMFCNKVAGWVRFDEWATLDDVPAEDAPRAKWIAYLKAHAIGVERNPSTSEPVLIIPHTHKKRTGEPGKTCKVQFDETNFVFGLRREKRTKSSPPVRQPPSSATSARATTTTIKSQRRRTPTSRMVPVRSASNRTSEWMQASAMPAPGTPSHSSMPPGTLAPGLMGMFGQSMYGMPGMAPLGGSNPAASMAALAASSAMLSSMYGMMPHGMMPGMMPHGMMMPPGALGFGGNPYAALVGPHATAALAPLALPAGVSRPVAVQAAGTLVAPTPAVQPPAPQPHSEVAMDVVSKIKPKAEPGVATAAIDSAWARLASHRVNLSDSIGISWIPNVSITAQMALVVMAGLLAAADDGESLNSLAAFATARQLALLPPSLSTDAIANRRALYASYIADAIADAVAAAHEITDGMTALLETAGSSLVDAWIGVGADGGLTIHPAFSEWCERMATAERTLLAAALLATPTMPGETYWTSATRPPVFAVSDIVRLVVALDAASRSARPVDVFESGYAAASRALIADLRLLVDFRAFAASPSSADPPPLPGAAFDAALAKSPVWPVVPDELTLFATADLDAFRPLWNAFTRSARIGAKLVWPFALHPSRKRARDAASGGASNDGDQQRERAESQGASVDDIPAEPAPKKARHL